MYHAYWGLSGTPFTEAATQDALRGSPTHAEALARLEFLRESQGGLGLLLGASGSGKTAIIAEFARRAIKGGDLVVALAVAGSEEEHLSCQLAAGLEIEGVERPAQLWTRLIDRLEELRLENRSAVILLDDLDRAAPSVLALAERLLAAPAAPLTVVVSARPEQAQRIGKRLLERASLRIELTPWDEEETRQYLEAAVVRAGRAQPAFSRDAVRRLFELSGGTVRRVNQLAELALLAGAGQKAVQIDAETIEAIQEELAALPAR